jgi:hypothetical protein
MNSSSDQTSVARLASSLWNIKIRKVDGRMSQPNWFATGSTLVKCSKCDNNLEVFRKKYTTNQGDFHYYVLICITCETAITPDQLPDDKSKRKLYKENKMLKNSIDKLKEKKVNSFWHLTHKNNIESILKHGILNHYNASKLSNYFDISDHQVQNLRENEEPIYHRRIHEYVPLFINPKNAMLFRLMKDIYIRNDLCLIEVFLDVIECEYLFTDGNAASRYTKFFKSLIDNFNSIPWDDIFNTSWYHSGVIYEATKSHMQSEFLIYPEIPPKYIGEIRCYSQNTVDSIKKFSNRAKLNTDAFFKI